MKEFNSILVFSDYENEETLSKNIDKKRIEIYAKKFQNQIMPDLIGEQFYSDFCKDSDFKISILSLTVSNDSVIALTNYPQGFGVGYWIYLTVNNKELGFFEVKTFNGISFTCELNNSEILVSGFCSLIFTQYSFQFRNIAKPYLIFGALSRFLPIANAVSTAYGFQSKRSDYSDDAANNTALIAEYKRNIDYYGKQMILFLQENKIIYPLYVEEITSDSFNFRENIGIRPKSRKLFDVKRK